MSRNLEELVPDPELSDPIHRCRTLPLSNNTSMAVSAFIHNHELAFNFLICLVLKASLVSLSVEDVSAALGCARNIYSPVMKVPVLSISFVLSIVIVIDCYGRYYHFLEPCMLVVTYMNSIRSLT